MEWKNPKDQLDDCFYVRKKVFILEQGFDINIEIDMYDNIAHHVCLYDEDNMPIATARLFADHDVYHCGRICILKEYRGKGLGKVLMQELEQKSKELGAKTLELSAQIRVKDFYEKVGFQCQGEEYLDEFCPHIKMTKAL